MSLVSIDNKLIAINNQILFSSPPQTTGSGTAEDPWQIWTPEDLANVGCGDTEGKYAGWTNTSFYKQMTNLDLSSYENFEPIGFVAGSSYQARQLWYGPFGYDGNGHTISNLTIYRPNDSYAALFSANIGGIGSYLKNIHIDNANITGYFCNGTLNGCTLDNILIENCSTTNSTVTSGHSTETAVSGQSRTGGLIGQTHCYISKCYVANTIVTGTGSVVGGCIGYPINLSTVTDSYVFGGSVQGGVANTFGGFLGKGLAGTQSVSRCWASVAVASGGYGFGNSTYITVINNFYDTELSGKSDTSGATPKATAQMKQQATFTGYDFTNVWNINENITNPYLRTNTQNPPPTPA